MFDRYGVQMIGAFQLENLVSQSLRFAFLNLCEGPFFGESSKAQDLLRSSNWVKPGGVDLFLEEQGVDLSGPIVCICEDGKRSLATAKKLVKKGHLNVLILEGGIRELEAL